MDGRGHVGSDCAGGSARIVKRRTASLGATPVCRYRDRTQHWRSHVISTAITNFETLRPNAGPGGDWVDHRCCAMRETHADRGGMFSYVSLESRVPAKHPLRRCRCCVWFAANDCWWTVELLSADQSARDPASAPSSTDGRKRCWNSPAYDHAAGGRGESIPLRARGPDDAEASPRTRRRRLTWRVGGRVIV